MNVDLPAFNVLSLFSGCGGLDYGLAMGRASESRPTRTVCYVEREAYAVQVLAARMEEGKLGAAPIWSDVTTFDGQPWRGVVDCITGGFPCTDISNAGKREGIVKGNRSGLWFEYARIVGEVRPEYVFIENVAALVKRGLDIVLRDLDEMGYNAEWAVHSAAEAGAPHRRERLFILAYASSQRRQQESGSASSNETTNGGTGRDTCQPDSHHVAPGIGQELADTESNGRDQWRPEPEGVGGRPDLAQQSGSVADAHMSRLEGTTRQSLQERSKRPASNSREDMGDSNDPGLEGRGLPDSERANQWAPWPPGPEDRDGWAQYLQEWPGLEPSVCRSAHGLADQSHEAVCLCHRVDRLRACGNGVVPTQAALAFKTLWNRAKRSQQAVSREDENAEIESLCALNDRSYEPPVA